MLVSMAQVPASLFGALDGRVTYVVGKDGKIKKIYDNVSGIVERCRSRWGGHIGPKTRPKGALDSQRFYHADPRNFSQSARTNKAVSMMMVWSSLLERRERGGRLSPNYPDSLFMVPFLPVCLLLLSTAIRSRDPRG